MKSNPTAEINFGANVCDKIKALYFPDQQWSASYKEISKKFTELKNIMRKAYPERETLDIVKELSTYSKQDIEDVFG